MSNNGKHLTTTAVLLVLFSFNALSMHVGKPQHSSQETVMIPRVQENAASEEELRKMEGTVREVPQVDNEGDEVVENVVVPAIDRDLFVVNGSVDREAMMAANDAIGTIALGGPPSDDKNLDDDDEKEKGETKLEISRDVGAETNTGRIMVDVGEPINLFFEVPKATSFFWTKSKLHVRHTGKGGQLVIAKARPSDSGFYQCLATDGTAAALSKEVFVDVGGNSHDRAEFALKPGSSSNGAASTDPLQLTRCMESMWEDFGFLSGFQEGSSYPIPPTCSYASHFCREAQLDICKRAGQEIGSGEVRDECTEVDVKCNWMVRDCFLQTKRPTDVGSFENCVYTKSMHLFGVPLNNDPNLIKIEYAFSEESGYMCVEGFEPDTLEYKISIPAKTKQIRLSVTGADGSNFTIHYATTVTSKKKPDKTLDPKASDWLYLSYFDKLSESDWIELATIAKEKEVSRDHFLTLHIRITSRSEDQKNTSIYGVKFIPGILSDKYDLRSLRTEPEVDGFLFRSDIDQYDDLRVSGDVSQLAFFPNEIEPNKAVMLLTVNRALPGSNPTLTNIVSLRPGPNIVTLRMEAEDGGLAPFAYTFRIERALFDRGDVITRHNALLESLEVFCLGSPILELSPVFDKEWQYYSIPVPGHCSRAFVLPKLLDPLAWVAIGGVAGYNRRRSEGIPLLGGNNKIDVVVTAADRATVSTYTLSLFRDAEFSNRATVKCSEVGGEPDLESVKILLPHGEQRIFSKRDCSSDESLLKVTADTKHVYILPVPNNHKSALCEVNSDSVQLAKDNDLSLSKLPNPVELFPGRNSIDISIFSSCEAAVSSLFPKMYTIYIDRDFPEVDGGDGVVTLSNLEIAGDVRWSRTKFTIHLDPLTPKSVHYGEDDEPIAIRLVAKVPMGTQHVMVQAVPTDRRSFLTVAGTALNPQTHKTPPMSYKRNTAITIQVTDTVKQKSSRYLLDLLEASSSASLTHLYIVPVFRTEIPAVIWKTVQARKCGCYEACFNAKDPYCYVEIDVSDPDAHLGVLSAFLPNGISTFFVVAQSDRMLNALIRFGNDESALPGSKISALVNVGLGKAFEVIVTSEDQSTTNTYSLLIQPKARDNRGSMPSSGVKGLKLVDFRMDRNQLFLQFNGFLDPSLFHYIGLAESDVPTLSWFDSDENEHFSWPLHGSTAMTDPMCNAFFPETQDSIQEDDFQPPRCYFSTCMSKPSKESSHKQCLQRIPQITGSLISTEQEEANWGHTERCLCEQGAIGFADHGAGSLLCRWECALQHDKRFIRLSFLHPVLGGKTRLEGLLASDQASIMFPEQSLKAVGARSNLVAKRTTPATLKKVEARFYGVKLAAPVNDGPSRSNNDDDETVDRAVGEFVLFLEFDGEIPCPGFASLDVDVPQLGKVTFRNHVYLEPQPKPWRDVMQDTYSGTVTPLIVDSLHLWYRKEYIYQFLVPENSRYEDWHLKESDFEWTADSCVKGGFQKTTAKHWILDFEVENTGSLDGDKHNYIPKRLVSQADPTVLILRSRILDIEQKVLDVLEGSSLDLVWASTHTNMLEARDTTGQPIRMAVKTSSHVLPLYYNDIEITTRNGEKPNIIKDDISLPNVLESAEIAAKAQSEMIRLESFPEESVHHKMFLEYLNFGVPGFSAEKGAPDETEQRRLDRAGSHYAWLQKDPEAEGWVTTTPFKQLKPVEDMFGELGRKGELSKYFGNLAYVAAGASRDLLELSTTISDSFIAASCGVPTLAPIFRPSNAEIFAVPATFSNGEIISGLDAFVGAARPDAKLLLALYKSCFSLICSEDPISEFQSPLTKPQILLQTLLHNPTKLNEGGSLRFPGELVGVTEVKDVPEGDMDWQQLNWDWLSNPIRGEPKRFIVDCGGKEECDFFIAMIPKMETDTDTPGYFRWRSAENLNSGMFFDRSDVLGSTWHGERSVTGFSSRVQSIYEANTLPVRAQLYPIFEKNPIPVTGDALQGRLKPIHATSNYFSDNQDALGVTPFEVTESRNFLDPKSFRMKGSCPGPFSDTTKFPNSKIVTPNIPGGQVRCGSDGLTWPACCERLSTPGCRDVPLSMDPVKKCAACSTKFTCPTLESKSVTDGYVPATTTSKIAKDFSSGGLFHRMFDMYDSCNAAKSTRMDDKRVTCLPTNPTPCSLRGNIPEMAGDAEDGADEGFGAAPQVGPKGEVMSWWYAPIFAPTSPTLALFESKHFKTQSLWKAVSQHAIGSPTFDQQVTGIDWGFANKKSTELGFSETRFQARDRANQKFKLSTVLQSQVERCTTLRGLFEELGNEQKIFTGVNVAFLDNVCFGKQHGSACRSPRGEGFCHGCCLPKEPPTSRGYFANELWLFGDEQQTRVWCDSNLQPSFETFFKDHPIGQRDQKEESPWRRGDTTRFFADSRLSICEAAWFLGPGKSCESDLTTCSVIVTFGRPDLFGSIQELRTFDVRWDRQRYGDPN